MDVSTDLVKALREETGVSIMQCRKALMEAGGDREKALILLRKQSSAIAAKKGDRTLGAGTVAAYIHSGGSVGAMVVLSSETDFVSKNEDFKKLAYDLAMHVAAASPKYLRYEDVPEADKEKAKEVFAEEIKDKPEAMREKIMEGKLSAYFGEKCLLNQQYIKDQEVTIASLIERAVQKFGERVEITRFVRFSAKN